MPSDAGDLADLDVVELVALLRDRTVSSLEVVDACLARIDARDGRHSFDGDPGSINAWVRVYPDEARAAAVAADARRSGKAVRDEGPAPALCGVPIGLKDLYGAAGVPLSASSRVLHQVPNADARAWRPLRRVGMVLVGHTHTHEFAWGATTDQVGNPWDLERSPGGSSGGSAAALAARMIPAATGSDTAGSLRIPSAACGTSTIKATRGLVSTEGMVPLAPTLDHPGPMARTVADCALMLGAMAGIEAAPASVSDRPLAGRTIARSPRTELIELDPDVAAGLERAVAACEALGATVLDPPRLDPLLEAFGDFATVFGADVLPYHRQFESVRDRYRPSTAEKLAGAQAAGASAEAYVAAQVRRGECASRLLDWFEDAGVFALIEPTIPLVAPLRGEGDARQGETDNPLIALTWYWNWTGFPVVALPAGLGAASGLPVGVSLIGPSGTEFSLADAGIALQSELGVPRPPGY